MAQEILTDSKCPLCRKELASNEYHAALKELENKVQQSYKEQNKTLTEQYEKQIEHLKEQHESESKRIEEDIANSYKKQLDMMQKNYDEISEQNQKQFSELKKQLESSHQKELQEKEKQIKEFQKEQAKFKKRAMEEAKTQFELRSGRLNDELRERDIQIKRFQDEVDSLKKQLTQSQSELKGEAGEMDLFVTMTDAFPQDSFRRQKRGTSTGDLIQRIRTTTGTLDTPIVYDNKAANNVTKTDIAKAKKYQKIHGTSYVLIVGQNLPKRNVPNGLLGEKDGIILVHPSIVVEVSKKIREGIVEISKLSNSKEDQKEKQDRLYQYVVSQEFSLILKSLSDLDEKLYALQAKEERDHQTLWKNRKSLQDELLKAYNELSSGIESITQEDSMVDISVESPGGK